MGLPIKIRPAVEGDLEFIFSSWLKSNHKSVYARAIKTTVYFREHHRAIEGVITRCNPLVACNPEDQSQIFGWVCQEPGLLHFVYVKQAYRRLGIGRELVGPLDGPFVYTHETVGLQHLDKGKHGIYNPYLIFFKGEK